MLRIYIGIDVGTNGGIAAINEERAPYVATRMPATDADLWLLLDRLTQAGKCLAVLEKVHSSPQMGVRSAFTFGANYGLCRMALTAARIPFDEIHPFKWQNKLGCLTKGDKNVSKARAQQLFPELKITHPIADALLLAEYCRRTQLSGDTEPP